MFAYVNHARIRSWNQPVLSNEGKVSCSRKQRGPSLGLKLTTDRYPPTTSQTRYPLRHATSLIGLINNNCIYIVPTLNSGNYHDQDTNRPIYLAYNFKMGFLTCSQYSNIIFSIANLILKGKSNIAMIT